MPDYLADTNIWLRLWDPAHAMSPTAAAALDAIDANLDAVYLVPQVMVECWRVATSTGSQRGGFGWDVAQADHAVQKLEQTYLMLSDTPAVYRRWRQLVRTAGVKGAEVYDARLVAAMLTHNLTHILTFNTDDFRRYAHLGIVAVHPATL